MLKYIVVQNEKQKLKEILRESVRLRRELLKKNNDDELKEFWQFYFVDTDLVGYILFYTYLVKVLKKKIVFIPDFV